MKSIDELIAELCPDGVEYKPLGEICEIVRGERLTKRELKEEGRYEVISGGVSALGRYDRFNREAGTVTIAQYGTAGYVAWRAERFWANDVCYSLVPYQYLLSRYLFFSLMANQMIVYSKVRRDAIPAHLPQEALAKLSIPLPPIVVQKEIVRILDDFTGLTAELETELAARRKQYEQYRERVLDFGNSDIYSCLGGVILSLNTGLNPRQFFKLNTKDATNYYVTIREIHDGKIVFSDKTDRINDTALSLCNNRSNLEVGDVLFSGTGTIGETAVIEEPPTNWNIKEGVYAVKPDPSKVLPRYLHYAFMCSSVRKAYGARIFGGTVKSISMKDLRKIKIPLPSLSEQRRIVEILDKFDALCNDETAGLVAEIAARKKQYEYYRDKLLIFKRKAI